MRSSQYRRVSLATRRGHAWPPTHSRYRLYPKTHRLLESVQIPPPCPACAPTGSSRAPARPGQGMHLSLSLTFAAPGGLCLLFKIVFRPLRGRESKAGKRQRWQQRRNIFHYINLMSIRIAPLPVGLFFHGHFLLLRMPMEKPYPRHWGGGAVPFCSFSSVFCFL